MPQHTTVSQVQASELAKKHDTSDQEQQLKEDPEDEEEQSQPQPKQERKPNSEEEFREAEESSARERPRPLFKRKNSYRAAQEKNPIAADEFWYVDKDPNRERTRSSGNLFDDERYYERQMARSVNNEQKKIKKVELNKIILHQVRPAEEQRQHGQHTRRPTVLA